MSKLDSLLIKINKLRRKMESLAFEKGSFNDPDVVAVSQRLDLLIIRYQRLKNISSALKSKESKLTG